MSVKAHLIHGAMLSCESSQPFTAAAQKVESTCAGTLTCAHLVEPVFPSLRLHIVSLNRWFVTTTLPLCVSVLLRQQNLESHSEKHLIFILKKRITQVNVSLQSYLRDTLLSFRRDFNTSGKIMGNLVECLMSFTKSSLMWWAYVAGEKRELCVVSWKDSNFTASSGDLYIFETDRHCSDMSTYL